MESQRSYLLKSAILIKGIEIKTVNIGSIITGIYNNTLLRSVEYLFCATKHCTKPPFISIAKKVVNNSSAILAQYNPISEKIIRVANAITPFLNIKDR